MRRRVAHLAEIEASREKKCAVCGSALAPIGNAPHDQNKERKVNERNRNQQSIAGRKFAFRFLNFRIPLAYQTIKKEGEAGHEY